MIRKWAKYSSAALLSSARIHRAIGTIARGRRVPPVIGYHRVVDDFASSASTAIPSLLISLKMLEKHIEHLGKRYRFVDLDQLGALVERGEVKNCVALTFDDGYRDFYELAFPLLQKKGIPAALFVVTDLIDTPEPQTHDALYALFNHLPESVTLPRVIAGVPVPDVKGHQPFEATRRWIQALPSAVLLRLIELLKARCSGVDLHLEPSRSVDWQMISTMHTAGITIGSHTRTHVLLPNESKSVAREEALGSRRILEKKLRTPVVHFAYPSGAYDDVSVKAVAEAGYKYAFTTCRHEDPEFPLLSIPRTLLWENSCLDAEGGFSGSVLECLIEGAFEPIAGCRQTHRRNPAEVAA